MNKKIISNKYFYAFFIFIKQKNIIDNCKEEIKFINGIFNKNSELLKILKNEFVPLENKYSLINDCFYFCSIYTKNFLKVLVKKKIIGEFLFSSEYFYFLCDEINSIINGVVYSANLLEKEQILKLEKVLKVKGFKTIKLENKIDKQLISGIKIIINNKIYDYSLINDLTTLKNKLIINN